MYKKVLVCQSRSCRKYNAAKILAAFQEYQIADVTIIGSGCLGKCGNGATILILPNLIWYSQADLLDVDDIVQKHLEY